MTLVRIFILVAFAVFSPTAQAQFGAQPIKILYGFAPGSGGDLLARLVGERMQAALGVSVVVENRTGGGGAIAMRALKTAAPDGNTIYIGPNGPTTIIPLFDPRAGYDPETDFAPLAQLVTYEFALAVAKNVPAKNLAELVDWLKANPDKGSYGTPASGSSLHFLGVKLAQDTRLDLRPVHYRGSVPAVTDAMSGVLPIVCLPLVDVIEQHRAGNVRIVATSDGERSVFVPEAPTFAEQGIDIKVTGWYGAFAPAKTPQAVLDRLNKIMVETVQAPQTKQKLFAMGFKSSGTSPTALNDIRKRETDFWRPIVKSSGFKAEE